MAIMGIFSVFFYAHDPTFQCFWHVAVTVQKINNYLNYGADKPFLTAAVSEIIKYHQKSSKITYSSSTKLGTHIENPDGLIWNWETSAQNVFGEWWNMSKSNLRCWWAHGRDLVVMEVSARFQGNSCVIALACARETGGHRGRTHGRTTGDDNNASGLAG